MAIQPDFDVVIVGAGFSGLGMAIALKRDGKRSFVVLEKADAVGGTWRDNRYPGCACDIPSNLYSFSFAQNPDWTRWYPSQPEIWDYLERTTDRFGIRPHIRFNAALSAAHWDDAGKLWRLETRDGQRLTARVFVSGMGGLHVPNMPAIPGIESFRGEAWHSAEWRDDIPLEGKRVAIIGAGASAIQIAPQIAPLVAQLDLYQRTPPYVLPKADPPTPAWLRALFKYFPPSQWLMRVLIYAINEARAPAFLDPLEGETLGMKFARRHRERQIADPVLREKATPQYRIGCKRVLVSDDYYPALCRENVALVTHAAARITPTGIVDSEGVERPADIILYATGFRPMDILSSVTITGEGGRRLNDEWAKHPEAYLATSVSGYPNFFTLLGPNSALGHNSVIYMIESQVRFVMDALRTLDAKGVAALDPKPEVQRAYNDDLQARLEKTVWGSGCTSWYLSEDGKNATLWPDYTFRFRARTKRVREADFDFVA